MLVYNRNLKGILNMQEVILKNVELRWPFLAKKNEGGEFASGKYQVDVVLSGENLKTIEDLKNKKQKIKERDGVSTITLKSSVKPRVYDRSKLAMSDEAIARIGNGTVAHVKVTQYSSKFGDYLGLGSIKVLDVKEYSGSDADFGDEDDEGQDEDLI